MAQHIATLSPTNLPIATCVVGADTAWMSVSTFLVLGMVLAVAFFEAGLVRAKNTLSIMAQIFFGAAIMGGLWYAVGFSFVYGTSHQVIGSFKYSFFIGLEFCCHSLAPTVPGLLFALYEMMFAIISPLLITGSFAEKVSFKTYIFFIFFWEILVYYPLAHQVWGGGWLFRRGVQDFAGGVVIHTAAGTAGLVCAIFIPKRKGFGEKEFKGHNVPMTALGVGAIFVTWFGFNGGSSYGANSLMAFAVTNTVMAAFSASFTWALCTMIMRRTVSVPDMLNGIIVGLVAITPACGFVNIYASVLIGIIAGMASYFGAILFKKKFKIDDSLDVWANHGIAGIVGTVLIGFFSNKAVNPAASDGILHHGGGILFAYQIVACLISFLWSGFFSMIILIVLKLMKWLEQIDENIDVKEHGETAYTFVVNDDEDYDRSLAMVDLQNKNKNQDKDSDSPNVSVNSSGLNMNGEN